MRKISVVNLPGTDYRYVALNDEPVYLQLALDQAYHPDGFYTFPSDEALRDEILRARQIGLNGLRQHVKIESPRKLYSADRLGVLIMADVPNSWGEPTPEMRQEIEGAMRGMIRRDYNHPSSSPGFPSTRRGGSTRAFPGPARRSPTRLSRRRSSGWPPSTGSEIPRSDRLVKDNSVCCGRPYRDRPQLVACLSARMGLDEGLDKASQGTRPGSTWNFEAGYKQDRQPNINSEFGNVRGYEGSTGDVDWSWDYHRAVNSFRRHPKIAGWLYTEHHDVINEWNGYWRFDRTRSSRAWKTSRPA